MKAASGGQGVDPLEGRVPGASAQGGHRGGHCEGLARHPRCRREGSPLQIQPLSSQRVIVAQGSGSPGTRVTHPDPSLLPPGLKDPSVLCLPPSPPPPLAPFSPRPLTPRPLRRRQPPRHVPPSSEVLPAACHRLTTCRSLYRFSPKTGRHPNTWSREVAFFGNRKVLPL